LSSYAEEFSKPGCRTREDGRVIPNELLQVFHEQIRLTDRDVPPGWISERDGLVHRSYPAAGTGYASIESPEGLGDDPDAVIAAQKEFFAGRGHTVEWKTYAYDSPADLPDRLTAAGFLPEEPEALILGEVDRIVELPSSLPSKIRIREIDSREDFDRIADLKIDVWGGKSDWISDLAEEQRNAPDLLVVCVVEDALAGPDGPALCAAWVRFHPGTEFASFWGGATRAEWRRKGLYRATLTYRARLAKERGYRYIRVDASEDSRPILERSGLMAVTTTTPYVLEDS
jgi:GNAT superfamily N-acetyltransferase